MEDICGILNFFGESSTVSDILSAIVLELYDLWNLQYYIAGLMHHAYSPCGAHDARSFGLLWIINLVPGEANGVRLKSNSPKMWV